MSRKHTDHLLLGLAIGLEVEHKARTHHDRRRFEHRVGCDVCMWLNVVMDELEARQYDGVLQDESPAPEGSAR